MAEYGKKKLFANEVIKKKFEELCRPYLKNVSCDSYAIFAEYAAVYDRLKLRKNKSFVLKNKHNLDLLSVYVSYPNRPEMFSSKATKALSIEEEYANLIFLVQLPLTPTSSLTISVLLNA